MRSREAEDPGLKGPTALDTFPPLSLLVVKGSCADATDDKESKDVNLEGVGIDAAIFAACPSVGEFVREEELLAGS